MMPSRTYSHIRKIDESQGRSGKRFIFAFETCNTDIEPGRVHDQAGEGHDDISLTEERVAFVGCTVHEDDYTPTDRGSFSIGKPNRPHIPGCAWHRSGLPCYCAMHITVLD
ncbi:hypothetical protein I7I51_07979 [Histoplasma capsulatum]|uniref:Uncharacterized protein n=1 Tax=Ajellomyces capsulatus TaxID=5037 RepID=A0A8A1M284_AJECA|nr:hypothetical protein I7I51_07979 [Histoplasma capsulatum]